MNRDKLRDFVVLAREAYDLAAYPPALDYSRIVDPGYRYELAGMSRVSLLQLGIDVKMMLNNLLDNLPRRRAEVLHAFFDDDWSEYQYAKLSYVQKCFLKRDKKTLYNRIRKGLIWRHY